MTEEAPAAPGQTRVWLLDGHATTVRGPVDQIASLLANSQAPLVKLELPSGRDVYINPDYVTRVEGMPSRKAQMR